MKRKVSILLTCFMAMICMTAFAQEEDNSADSYKENLRIYKFKKHQSELGVHGGHFFVAGDVAPEFGWGAGLHFRRAIDFAFSVRLDAMYGQARGIEPEPSALPPAFNTDNGFAGTNQYEPGKNNWYPNFQNEYFGLSLSGVFSLNAFNFNQQLKRFNPYLLAGVGVNQQTVSYDALDGENVYNFEEFNDLNPSASADDRKDIRDGIKDLLDRDYETEITPGTPSEEDGKIRFQANFGAGVSFKVSKNFNIGLEHQVILPFGSEADLADGYNYNPQGGISTDLFNYTSLRFNFDIGNTQTGDRLDPLYWVGPTDLLAEDVASIAKRVDESLRDSDGDGVLDMVDEDPETPEGATVDTRGNLLDSDRDGVADYQDKEPHSPPNYPVDADGIAQVPDPGYTTEDDVNRIVDAKLAEFRSTLNPNFSWFLPMVNFSFNSFTVRSSEYGKLHSVASVMQQNENLKLIVKGYADQPGSDCYNQTLSYNRAESVISYISNKYDLDADRFLINYGGEAEPIVDTRGRSTMNRRVEFMVAQPDDKGQAKPDCGVEKAGTGKKDYSGNKQGF